MNGWTPDRGRRRGHLHPVSAQSGTYVQLAAPDEVVLKNIHGDAAVGMAWDMLLVLHRLSDWINQVA